MKQTPQEKADQLVKIFFPDLKEFLDLELVGIRKKHAISSSLKSVDDTLETLWKTHKNLEEWNFYNLVRDRLEVM